MQALKIHPRDTVAIAIKELHKGTMVTIEATTVRLRDDIPAGHKFSLGGIAAGTAVIKYGYSIGVASRDIEMGEWVHDHNLQSHLGGVGEYSWAPSGKKPAVPSRKLTFNGYVRPDGSVGIRNELWVVPMVGCVNGIAEQIVKITRARGLPVNIENVVAFPHPFGCSQLGGDLEHTQKILAGLVKHPNAGGVLLLWLGCENNTPEGFKAVLGDIDPQRIRTLNCQDAGDEIDTGVRMLSELLVYSAQFKRQPVPLSRLRVGFKCGGSDGFSGLTANPLAGRICDRVTGGGGTAVITEVPEMFGAETILFNRCVSEKVFKQAVKMVNGFKSYFISITSRSARIRRRATMPAASPRSRKNRSAASRRVATAWSPPSSTTANRPGCPASICWMAPATTSSPPPRWPPPAAIWSSSPPAAAARWADRSRSSRSQATARSPRPRPAGSISMPAGRSRESRSTCWPRN